MRTGNIDDGCIRCLTDHELAMVAMNHPVVLRPDIKNRDWTLAQRGPRVDPQQKADTRG
jgi:hypothetical protein